MMGDPKLALHLYIPDDVVESVEQDAFGHLHVADAIVQSIINTSPPYIIGVFGSWGTGKSSILSLVNGELEKNGVVTVLIDAWQYSSATDLKRAFLVRIAKVLAPTLLADLRAKLYTTEQEKVEPRPSDSEERVRTRIVKGAKKLAAFSVRVFFTFLLFSALFFGLLAILVAIRSVLSTEHGFSFVEVLNLFIDLAFVPFVVALVGQLQPLITQEPVLVQRERIDADELFAEYFNKVVDRAVSRPICADRRLVIFVDNLDRLNDEKMVMALEALKTYLGNENCIFVVACDDHVVRAVVERSDLVPGIGKDKDKESEEEKRRLGEDYLDKFFQQTFRLPAYMEVDLSDFAESQFSRTRLHIALDQAGVNVGYLVSTILPSDANSPRKVKRLLNEFIASYEVAIRRESEESGRLQPGALTDDPEFLGKFSTLRAEFPEFYSKLVERPSLLRAVTDDIRALNDNEALNKIRDSVPSANRQSLLGYLRKTQHVEVADIDPYIWLSQDSLSIGLSADKAMDLRIALSDGNYKKVVQMLEGAENEDEKDRLARVASRYVGLRLRGINQQNGTLVLCRIVDRVNPTVQVEVAQVAANLIPRFPLRGFQAGDILLVLQKANRSEKRELVNELLKRLDEDDLRLGTFESILEYSQVIEEAGATPLVQEWVKDQFEPEE